MPPTWQIANTTTAEESNLGLQSGHATSFIEIDPLLLAQRSDLLVKISETDLSECTQKADYEVSLDLISHISRIAETNISPEALLEYTVGILLDTFNINNKIPSNYTEWMLAIIRLNQYSYKLPFTTSILLKTTIQLFQDAYPIDQYLDDFDKILIIQALIGKTEHLTAIYAENGTLSEAPRATRELAETNTTFGNVTANYVAKWYAKNYARDPIQNSSYLNVYFDVIRRALDYKTRFAATSLSADWDPGRIFPEAPFLILKNRLSTMRVFRQLLEFVGSVRDNGVALSAVGHIKLPYKVGSSSNVTNSHDEIFRAREQIRQEAQAILKRLVALQPSLANHPEITSLATAFIRE